jgi:hypothetical protein
LAAIFSLFRVFSWQSVDVGGDAVSVVIFLAPDQIFLQMPKEWLGQTDYRHGPTSLVSSYLWLTGFTEARTERLDLYRAPEQDEQKNIS